MLTINNETLLKDLSILEEVSNTFKLLPTSVEKLANIYNLNIHYQEGDIKAYSIKNKELIIFENALGLFDSQHEDTHYDIYIAVSKNETAYKRVETLMHELGHFIDYVVGKELEPAIDGHHFYSYNNDYWYAYHNEIVEIINETMPACDTSYWTAQIIEQYAQYFALKGLGKIPYKHYELFSVYDNHMEECMDEIVAYHEMHDKLLFKLKEKVMNMNYEFKNSLKNFSLLKNVLKMNK